MEDETHWYDKLRKGAKQPPLPKPRDEESLLRFTDWLLSFPGYRRYASLSKELPLQDVNEFAIQIVKQLPHVAFCNKLLQESPRRFQELVGELFRNLGGSVVLGGNNADGAIDVLWKTGMGSYILQCKRWRNKVGEPVVREVCGAAADGTVEVRGCFIVTTSEFTDNAVRFAESVRKPRIGLIDGKELFNLMSQVMPTMVQDIQRRSSEK
jgi:restriction endonuclease Mrr